MRRPIRQVQEAPRFVLPFRFGRDLPESSQCPQHIFRIGIGTDRTAQLLQESGYLVLRYLAEDLAKELDSVLDGILRSLSSRLKPGPMAIPITVVRESRA
jgi:hypothetical protein